MFTDSVCPLVDIKNMKNRDNSLKPKKVQLIPSTGVFCEKMLQFNNSLQIHIKGQIQGFLVFFKVKYSKQLNIHSFSQKRAIN